jgi:hypothetical protein
VIKTFFKVDSILPNLIQLVITCKESDLNRFYQKRIFRTWHYGEASVADRTIF